ncbi:hypothetical protein [Methanobacterium sp. SMA-27]|uniref:hypothetical protein n=1 Tax=Methanobacterium sp. SMA-27 TaxID=1495336 RepID=UPI00064EF8B8|nr:hypothetical protein [Methanobacterium sp. SMA-27]
MNSIRGHFYLQKYIYLAKIEGEIPIEYEFSKDDYGPYSLGIKTDAFRLKDEGYIELNDDYGVWIFEITPKGRLIIEKIISALPKTNINNFDEILNKFHIYSFTKLKNYVYDQHIKEDVENNKLKKQILLDIKDLLSIFKSLESTSNSMFIRGSLDYCSLVLKNENLTDPIKKDMLLSYISSYNNFVLKLNELTIDEPNILEHLNLEEANEKFNYIQEICSKELNIFPRLDDDSVDLELFLDDEDDDPLTPLFTSPIRC